jgi:hypothetical protein
VREERDVEGKDLLGAWRRNIPKEKRGRRWERIESGCGERRWFSEGP